MSLQSTCARDGCERRPTHYLLIFIPAKGVWPVKCLKLTAGLALCRDHASEETAESFITDAIRDCVNSLTGQYRLAQPDFESAWLEVRRLGDANWEAFMAGQAAGEGGGRA